MKNIFLIDFENVAYSFTSLSLLKEAKENDIIYLFISDSSLIYVPKTMTFLKACKAKVVFQYCKGTCKNNMDIYIAGIMGDLLHNIKKMDHLYIVSQDHGYDGIINYFSDRYQIKRISPKQEIFSIDTVVQKVNDNVFAELEQFCSEAVTKPSNEIGKYKSQVYNFLVQKYKEDGKEYYKIFIKKFKERNAESFTQ